MSNERVAVIRVAAQRLDDAVSQALDLVGGLERVSRSYCLLLEGLPAAHERWMAARGSA